MSSTSDITVTGTTAAVLYDTDIINTLNSTDATKPLSANMGHTLGEEINAIVNVYGAKNLLPNEGVSMTSSGVTFTVNDDKSITINADGTNASEVDFYFYNHNNSVHDDWRGAILSGISGGSNTTYQIIVQYRNPNLDWLYLSDGEATLPNSNTFDSVRIRVYANTTLTNVTVYPMIRDARIVDPTYEPYAETNHQLTVNKANRDDLSDIIINGATNNTGATITMGTYFYLNGVFCRALTDVANGATFTLNTNYKTVTVGACLLKEESVTAYLESNNNYTLGHGTAKMVSFKSSQSLTGDLFLFWSLTAQKWYVHFDTSGTAPATITGTLYYFE